MINQVLAQAPGSSQFLPVTAGAPVLTGTQLRTLASSLARLDFPDGSYIRLGPDSDVSLDSDSSESGLPTLRARLFRGKLYAILKRDILQVYSAAGVTILSGSRASVQYVPGDDGQSSRITLIVDCLEATCSVMTEANHYELHNGEEQRVSADGQQDERAPLPESALRDFLLQNPEMVETAFTATPQLLPATASPVPEVSSATAAPSPTVGPPTVTPAPPTRAPTSPPATLELTLNAPPTAGSPLAPGLLGQHVVRSGETIYCIARAYGVLPEAIVTTNALADAAALSVDQTLDIPPVPWPDPSAGPVCQAQFGSPYVTRSAPATSTPGSLAVTPGELAPTATLAVMPVWATPVNLSRSGAASQPIITVDGQGDVYAAWWDQFDGATYMVNQPGQGWSVHLAAPVVYGAPPASVGQIFAPPAGWQMLAEANGTLHMLWLDQNGRLLHASNSSPATGGAWSGVDVLAAQVLVWRASLAGDSLQVAYIQTDQDGAQPPGVYFRRSAGATWGLALTLATSPYLRSLRAKSAYLDLATNGAGEVDVAWDDPQSLSSRFARSTDEGQSFSESVALSAADPRIDVQAHHLQLWPVPGGFLRQWQAGPACSLFQQQLSGPHGSWSAPVRVLEQLPGCPTASQANALPDGRLVLWATLDNNTSPNNLMLWNGNRWSQSLRADFSFVDLASNRPAQLSCLQTDLSGEQIIVLGCDGHGDVWFTTSQLSLNDLLPALAGEWRAPVALSDSSANAGLPAAALEGEVIHALWPQDVLNNPDAQRLYAAQGSGQDWSPAAQVLQARQDGPMAMPVIVTDPRGWLHAVWSGEPNGQIYYSRSFLRDANTAQGWSPPVALPAPQASGGWPAMALEPDGRLVVAYALPFNEGRGVYLVTSPDAGESWSAPSRVFDAAAAGWATVQDTQLAVDGVGGLHLLVERGSLPPAASSLGVYYLRSADDGQTWSEPQAFGDSDASYPRLLATARGELFRFWDQPGSSEQPVWQEWSQDDGQNWSAPVLVPGLRNASPSVGLASDGQGAIFLVAVVSQPGQSAALAYVRWDGQHWVDQQYLPLGYTADSASGVVAILLPEHRLGAFYRVTTSANPGTGPYILGYSEREVPGSDLPPLATLTPTSPAAASAAPSQQPTLTPLPTLDKGSQQVGGAPPSPKWTTIAAILSVMVLVLGISVWQLTRRR